jgi:hypothetical protein
MAFVAIATDCMAQPPALAQRRGKSSGVESPVANAVTIAEKAAIGWLLDLLPNAASN